MNRRLVLPLLAVTPVFVFALHALAAPPVPSRPPIKRPVNTAVQPKIAALSVPGFKFNELKATKGLSLNQKVRIVRATGPAEERDLEAPVTLSPRNPWHASGASMNFHEPRTVRGDDDVAYLPQSSSAGGPFVAIKFTAQPDRRYLVDCRIVTAARTVEMSAMTGGGIVPRVHARASVTPSDRHATLVVPKASGARDLLVTVHVNGDANQNWGLWSCEITGIR